MIKPKHMIYFPFAEGKEVPLYPTTIRPGRDEAFGSSPSRSYLALQPGQRDEPGPGLILSMTEQWWHTGMGRERQGQAVASGQTLRGSETKGISGNWQEKRQVPPEPLLLGPSQQTRGLRGPSPCLPLSFSCNRTKTDSVLQFHNSLQSFQ